MLVFFITDILQQTLRHQGPDKKLFYFLRDQLIALETSGHEKLFPTYFLAQYLMLLGYAPLDQELNSTVFDYQKGVFGTHDISSLASIQNPELVAFIKAQFWPQTSNLTWPSHIYKEGLNVLIKYAQQHIVGFNLGQTMEILHDTLYD